MKYQHFNLPILPPFLNHNNKLQLKHFCANGNTLPRRYFDWWLTLSSLCLWFCEWITAPMVQKVMYPFNWQSKETQNVVHYLSPIHDEKWRWSPKPPGLFTGYNDGSYCFLTLLKSISQQSLPLFLLKNYFTMTNVNYIGDLN